MFRPLDLHADARREFYDALEWYGAESSELAADFASEITRALNRIEESPGTWPTWKAGTRRYLVRRFPYQLIYVIEDNRVLVVAIRHFKRHPTDWIARLSPPADST